MVVLKIFLSILLGLFLAKNEVHGIMDCENAPTEPMMKICYELQKKYTNAGGQIPYKNHPPMAPSPDDKAEDRASQEMPTYAKEVGADRADQFPKPQPLEQPQDPQVPLGGIQTMYNGQPVILFQDSFPMRQKGLLDMENQRENPNTPDLARMWDSMRMSLLPMGPILGGYSDAVKKMEGIPDNVQHPQQPPMAPMNAMSPQNDGPRPGFNPHFTEEDDSKVENFNITKELKGNYTSDAWMCTNFTCLCPYFDGKIDSDGACILPSGRPLTTAVRKEYRTLTDDERHAYHAAIKTLMENGLFDELGALHLHISQGNSAHTGPNFWPWHRGYLKRFEVELRKINPDLAIPYWDSTLDQNLPNSRDSIMWTDEFMGRIDENGTVVSGPGAHWITLAGNPLHRRPPSKFGGALFHENDLRFVLGETQLWMPNRIAEMGMRKKFHCAQQLEFLEIMHGDPHHYVGGDMEDLPTATNDPIFFMHHCFVDVVWELWRQQKDPDCHLPGLVDNDTDLTFSYAPRPTCSHENPDCGSPYLFCDRSRREARCAAKIIPDGLCKGLDDRDEPCLDGSCHAGKCVKDSQKDLKKAYNTEALVPNQSFEEAENPNQQEALNLLNFATHLQRNMFQKNDYKLEDVKNAQTPLEFRA